MLATVHVAVGAAIGSYIGDPFIVAPLSFISHYFLDAVPHFKWKKLKLKKNHHMNVKAFKAFWYEAIEPLIAFSLAIYLYALAPEDLKVPVLVGIIFNQIPDLLVFLEWRYGIKRPFPIRQIENATHRHSISFMGVANQVIVLVPTMYYLLK